MSVIDVSRWIAMAEVAIKRSLSKSVMDKASTGVCLHCSNPGKKRGLCSKHYEQFRRQRLRVKQKERVQWEIDQIHEGKILNALQILQIKTDNVFAD